MVAVAPQDHSFISELLDGDLDEAAQDEFNALLKASPEARTLYRQRMELHAALQQEAIANGWRDETDVVVVGSGGAGLAAAVAARDEGAAVIVLVTRIQEVNDRASALLIALPLTSVLATARFPAS